MLLTQTHSAFLFSVSVTLLALFVFGYVQGALHWRCTDAGRDSDAHYWSASSGCRVPYRKVDCIELVCPSSNDLLELRAQSPNAHLNRSTAVNE